MRHHRRRCCTSTASATALAAVAVAVAVLVLTAPSWSPARAAALPLIRNFQENIFVDNLDRFGHAVAGNSGSLLAVGAYQHNSGEGRVDVFALDDAVSSLVASVPAPGGGLQNFGVALDLTDDGLLVVGASTGFAGGIMYSYAANGTGVSYLNAAPNPNALGGDDFGKRVSVNDQGAVVVGSPGFVSNAGRAYMFSADAATGDLDQDCAFAPPGGVDSEDMFGDAVAIAGEWVVVGAPGTDGAGSSEGAAYVFKVNGAGCVDHTDSLSAPVASAEARFGSAVSVSGAYLVVGAPMGVSSLVMAGRSYVYALNQTDGTAALIADLASPDTTGQVGFGSGVAVSGSLGAVVIGAPRASGSGTETGLFFVYTTNVTTLSVDLVGAVDPSTSMNDDEFGSALRFMSDGRLAVGAAGRNTFDGAVYVFGFRKPVGVVWADSDYCTAKSVAPFSGACIAAAIGEANASPGVFGSVLLEPGVYLGCLPGGVAITSADLVVAAAVVSSASSPAVTWSCEMDGDGRHLRIDGASNVTLSGIAFMASALQSGDGGVAAVTLSADIAFERCRFDGVSSLGGRGGAIAAVDSTIRVVDSMATNVDALQSGGFVYSSGGTLTVSNTNVTVASSGQLGGAIYLDNGVVENVNVATGTARFGGAIYAFVDTGTLVLDHVTATGSQAAVSGGAVFLDIGTSNPSAVAITNTTVSQSTAVAFGGGLAVRAARLVEDPGARSLDITGLTAENCLAHRGGGIFSEVDTLLTTSTLTGNNAVEAGGGAAFQPAPCLSSLVIVDGSTFDSNTAPVGGGMHVLSAAVSVLATRFLTNTAIDNGAGLAIDCAHESCLSEVPRAACDVVHGAVEASVFDAGRAGGDGGGIHVAHRGFNVSAAGSSFASNIAMRGAMIFSGDDAQVFVDGSTGVDASFVLTTVSNGDSNFATNYGAILASGPSELFWKTAPPVTQTGGPAMAGENFCRDQDGCVITMMDAYGIVPTLATVVRIVAFSNDATVALQGPQYVLVNGGESEAIADLGVRFVDDFTPPDTALVSFGIDFDGSFPLDVDYDLLTITRCDPGYGAVAASGEVWCEPCGVGFFSDQTSWDPCSSCDDGYATQPGTEGAISCTWCAAGYGWVDDACTACGIGEYAGEPTEASACRPCADGLTTNSTGSVTCDLPDFEQFPAAQDVNTTAIVVTVALALISIVALIVSCVRKKDARHGAIATVMLSVYDVVTDYLFLFAMVSESKSGTSPPPNLDTLIGIGAGSVGVAFAINLLLTSYILFRERRRPDFAKWMRNNLVPVAVMAVLGTTNVSVLKALDSEVFRIGATRAPFAPETKDLIEFGGVASVIFEDAPQLVVAIVYLSSGGSSGGNLAVVYLTILASAAGVLTGLFLRLILCCVVGADRDDVAAVDGEELGRLNPADVGEGDGDVYAEM